MSQSTTIASQCATWSSARSIARAIPSRRTSPMVTTRLPAVDRVLVHRRGCWRSWRARPARCSRPAGRPRSAPAPDCRCSGPGRVSRMSKWASSVISPTLSSGRPSAEHARPRHRIVAADEQGQRVRARRSPRTASRIERRRFLDASGRRSSTSPRSAIWRRQLAAGLDIVAADPPQRLRAAAPAPGRTRPASPIRRPAARRPARPARRASSRRHQVGKIGPARSSL